MAANPHYSDAAANAAANAIAALLNTGYLRFYDGTQPANANTALSGNTLLAELRFGATAFAGANAGVALANAITAATAVATSTATFYRCLKSDGTTVVMDGDLATSAADGIINSASIVTGASVAAASFSLAITE